MQSMKSTLNFIIGRPSALIASITIVLSCTYTARAGNYNYSATILSNNPAAYYEMQESPGASMAIDSSSNGLFSGSIVYDQDENGTNDYPVLGLPGVDTNAYLFHVYTDTNFEQHVSYIDVGYSPTLNPQGPFTAECWARPTSDANNYDPVVATGGGSYKFPGWFILQTPGTPGAWALDIQTCGVYIQSGSATKNQWTHLVAVYDGVNFTFYVNGVAIGTQSGSGYIAQSAEDFFIGGAPKADYGAFEGYITEVAIYTNALSAAQVLNDYQVGTNSFSTNAELPSVLVDVAETNTDPASVTVNNGAIATFDPIAVGSIPLSYQWYTNGVAEGGATNSILSFTTTGAEDDSTYYVVVTNNFGSTTSQVATLTVISTLVINSDPMSIIRNVGGYAAFHVTASGTAPLAYQWSVSTNGGSTFNSIPGATQETLWLSDVQLSESGNQYSVLVSGPGVTPSNTPPATLTVQPRPVNVPLTGYGAVVAADKPVAFWQLNEPSGSEYAIDAVGSFDGIYTYAVTNTAEGSGDDLSSITWGVTGGVPDDTNTAVNFVEVSPDVGGTVQVPWAPELNPDIPWSVETWVQPTSVQGDYPSPLSSSYNEGTGNGPTSGWYFYEQSGEWTFVIQPANQWISGGSVVAGNWYYLVVTDDGTNFNFYINGVLATAPYPANSADFVANGDGINSDGTASIGGLNGGNFVIAERTDDAFGAFNGSVEDTAVYNYALTPQQIQNHYLNAVSLTITQSGKNVILNWPAGTGTLQQSANVTGPYVNLGAATPPYTTPMSSQMFYRLLRQ